MQLAQFIIVHYSWTLIYFVIENMRERERENGRNFEKSRMINRSKILIVNDKIMSVEKRIRGFSDFIYVTWIYFVMENIREREKMEGISKNRFLRMSI